MGRLLLQQTIPGWSYILIFTRLLKTRLELLLMLFPRSPNPTVTACAPDYDNGPPEPYAGDAEWEYLGCYTEATNSRALTGSSYTSSTNMTGESCVAFCAGYTYAGVEYTEEVSTSFHSHLVLDQRVVVQ